MGVEFFLVSDATRDAYELGKGDWAPIEARPITPEDLHAVVTRALGDHLPSGYIERLVNEIGAFMSSHPDWKLGDDTGARGEIWVGEDENDLPGELGDRWTKVYVKRGTRYEG